MGRCQDYWAEQRFQALKDAAKAAQDDEYWSRGAQGITKRDIVEAKKAEAQRNKAWKSEKVAEELEGIKEKKHGRRATTSNKKTAVKKTNRAQDTTPGLVLTQLDGLSKPHDKYDDKLTCSFKQTAALNAGSVDDSTPGALALAGDGSPHAGVDSKTPKNPERFFKAAYVKFQARRLEEMKRDKRFASLRLWQRQDLIRREFESSPENPFNQVSAAPDASHDELQQIRD